MRVDTRYSTLLVIFDRLKVKPDTALLLDTQPCPDQTDDHLPSWDGTGNVADVSKSLEKFCGSWRAFDSAPPNWCARLSRLYYSLSNVIWQSNTAFFF